MSAVAVHVLRTFPTERGDDHELRPQRCAATPVRAFLYCGSMEIIFF